MKKIFLLAIALVVLSIGASADGYMKLGIGSYGIHYSNAKNAKNIARYEVALGGSKNAYGNIFLGSEIALGTDSSNVENVDISGNVLIGYSVAPSVAFYGIIGYSWISLYSTSTSATTTRWPKSGSGHGLKYGTGTQYKIAKHFSVGVEYTVVKYNFTDITGTVDFTNLSANIKFYF